jgi:hypothetical protein
MLHNDYFHDKIARHDVISNFLDNLFDPHMPRQFTAVAYCISQLASYEACAAILVECEVIKLTIGFLTDAPKESIPYIWHVLVSISKQKKFFDAIAKEKDLLFPILYSVVSAGDDEQIDSITTLVYNLTLRPEFNDYMELKNIETFVKTLKLIIYKAHHRKPIVIDTLINLATTIRSSRSFILGYDLMQVFEAGSDIPLQTNYQQTFDRVITAKDVAQYLQYAALLNLISCEENLCLNLLDVGAHAIL